MSSKKSLAKQLTVKELRDILHKKGLKIPSKWGKRELVSFVEANCTKKEIEEVVKQKVKGRTYREKGFEAQLKGIKLEDKVMKIFQRKGYTCEKNIRPKKGVRAEFDIIGYKEERSFLSSTTNWIFVECKNKAKVIASDWKKFLGNFNTFKKRKEISDENIMGYIYTTGLFDNDVRKEARLYKNIQLKRKKI